MKVIQIDIAANIGSTGTIAEEIGIKIIQNFGESYIAFGRYSRRSKSKLIKIGNKYDQAWHFLMTRFFDRHALHSKKATKDLINKIKIINPDIIHLHQVHGYYLNLVELMVFLKKYDKPVVWTFHDCWQYTGHCCYYSRFDCDKFITECSNCPLTSYYPSSILIDNSKSNFNIKKKYITEIRNLTIVPVSNWLHTEIKKSFLKNKNIKTILNGIDLQVFYPDSSYDLKQKYKIKSKNIWLGVASIWTDLKGLNDFYELSKLVDSDTQIVLVGLSKKQIKALPKNILGISRTENLSELRQFYSQAEVFINPSISESFGLVTVEAMACGTPVVVYNCTASPELISDKTGIIVPVKEYHALFKAAEKICKIGKSHYSSDCINRVKENYNKDIQYNKYISLYKELLIN